MMINSHCFTSSGSHEEQGRCLYHIFLTFMLLYSERFSGRFFLEFRFCGHISDTIFKNVILDGIDPLSEVVTIPT